MNKETSDDLVGIIKSQRDDAVSLQNVCQYAENVYLSAPALLVCCPFSDFCHSRSKTQRAHCSEDVLHFRVRVDKNTGMSRSEVL